MKEGHATLSYNYPPKMIEIFKIALIFSVDNEGNNDTRHFSHWVCRLLRSCTGGAG